jgi:hypothetical protein
VARRLYHGAAASRSYLKPLQLASGSLGLRDAALPHAVNDPQRSQATTDTRQALQSAPTLTPATLGVPELAAARFGLRKKHWRAARPCR